MRAILVLFVSLLLASCDVLLDEAVDCLDNDRPQFDRSTLPDAVLNQEYSADIVASIKNEPYDDWYRYQFDIIGELPRGLSEERTSRRTLTIQGTPTETGTFSFVLEVEVFEPDSYYGDSDGHLYIDDDGIHYDDGDDLCSNYRRRQYVIEVNEEI